MAKPISMEDAKYKLTKFQAIQADEYSRLAAVIKEIKDKGYTSWVDVLGAYKDSYTDMSVVANGEYTAIIQSVMDENKKTADK